MASVGPPAVEPVPSDGAAVAPAPGVLDLYRTVWDAARGSVVRHRITIAVEVAVIAAWFLLRTGYGVDSRPYLAWTVVAAAVALISPTSGLVLLAATGPFFEPVTIGGVLGMRHLLVAVLGVSVVIRLVAGGWRRMPWSPPVLLAIAIGGLTAIGVLVTAARFPSEWTRVAASTWLSSIGGAMIVLVVAVWVARDRTVRPLIAVLGSATAAVGLSVIDQLHRGSISQGPLAWIGFWKDFGSRLGGAVPSPNGMAALAVMPVCILATWAILGRPQQTLLVISRIIAAIAAAVLFLAMYLTYSRAAILSLFGLAVVIAWRVNRRLGKVVLVVGIVAGVALLPSYLALRGQATNVGVLEPGSLLVATDALRLQAWDSAFHMWLNQPVTGQGFLAYKQLADAYGDTVLSSPHNEWLRLFAEEGTIGGIIGLGFLATTVWWLTRRRGPVARGILAGAIGYGLMASFNNPLLFIQVSAIVFVGVGYGLAMSVPSRMASRPADVTGNADAQHP